MSNNKSSNDKSNAKASERASSEEDSQSKGFLTDTLKKVFAASVGSAFMNEESLKSYLSEMKLPKEILSLILQGAQRTKDEVTGRVTNELLGLVRKIDLVKEFSRFAETHKFKINAEIEIIKKSEDVSKGNKV